MQSPRVPRLARKVAVICLAFAVLLASGVAFSARAAAARPLPIAAHVTDSLARTTRDERIRQKDPARMIALAASATEGDALLAFAPLDAGAGAHARGAKPITVVYLHGIHGLPQNGCPWFHEGASELGWLVCPHANAQLPTGTFSWGGTTREQRAVVARAELAAQAQGADPEAANVLVGFSQGAYVAVNLVRGRLGRYRGLVLLGADVTPSRSMLEASGVSRIVLAAGELDPASAPMKRAAEQLRRDGMAVRFVSLGPIGHSYQTTEKEALRDAIVWAGSSS